MLLGLICMDCFVGNRRWITYEGVYIDDHWRDLLKRRDRCKRNKTVKKILNNEKKIFHIFVDRNRSRSPKWENTSGVSVHHFDYLKHMKREQLYGLQLYQRSRSISWVIIDFPPNLHERSRGCYSSFGTHRKYERRSVSVLPTYQGP